MRIGDADLYPERSLVRRGGHDTFLRPQALRVLLYLIEHPDRIVSRDELHGAIWGDTAVTPDALVQCIVDIRKALGDPPKQPRFIRTVSRLGYEFLSPVEDARAGTLEAEAAGVDAVERPASESRAPRRWWPWRAVATAAVAALFAVMAIARMAPARPTEWSTADGTLRIVVVPFKNESRDQTMAWLQNGLPNMLVTGLGRSTGASAVTLAELRPFLGLDGDDAEPPSVDKALLIARTARADVVLRGSFTTVGDTLRVDVRLTGPNGEPLGTDFVVAARREAVLTQIDRLSERLTKTLGLEIPARGPAFQLSDVMTPDLDAYRDYVLGVQKARAMEPREALALFQSAARRDPDFAMAHARIGATHAVTEGDAETGRPYLAKAFQLSGRLRDVDRLWILAWYSLAKLDYDGAMTPLRALIARFPSEIEAHTLLAKVLIGQERWAEASEVIEQGLAIDPGATDLHNQASRAAAGAGRRDAALEAARRYVALAPREANAFDTLGLRLHGYGRYGEAVDAFARALTINPQFDIAWAHMGNAYLADGRYRDATRAYEMLGRTRDRSRAYAALAWIAFRRGDTGRARSLAERATAASPRDPWPAVVLAADRHDVAAYRRIRDQGAFDKYSNRGTSWPPILLHYMAGLDLRMAGRTDEALAELREAVRHTPLDWATESFEDCLGEAYFDLGRLDEAHTEYRRLAELRPWVARYHYRLGQIADRRGDADSALADYRRFLTLWRNADPDLPEVIAARQRIGRPPH